MCRHLQLSFSDSSALCCEVPYQGCPPRPPFPHSISNCSSIERTALNDCSHDSFFHSTSLPLHRGPQLVVPPVFTSLPACARDQSITQPLTPFSHCSSCVLHCQELNSARIQLIIVPGAAPGCVASREYSVYCY